MKCLILVKVKYMNILYVYGKVITGWISFFFFTANFVEQFRTKNSSYMYTGHFAGGAMLQIRLVFYNQKY